MSRLSPRIVRLGFQLRVALLLTSFAAATQAGTVKLTEGPPFTFTSGSDLYVTFSAWSYAVNNPGYSPYPTSVGLQLMGGQPSTSKLNNVPGSTSTYFDGYLLQGWLENMSGTVSVPFSSPDAARLGLAESHLILQPGSISPSNSPIAVIEADASFTLALSEQIFGPDITRRGSSAVIHLRNIGNDLEIGLEGGYSLLSAVREPSISGDGAVRTSGVTQSLAVAAVPEPGNFAIYLILTAFALAFSFKQWRRV